ncbi:short chain dehydrogenase [Pseudohongiella nitratireducens]|uniref:Short chain dehydrogenase n=1 Tax=Pseudohongiella nitratireducens TaxID=1768907 RepID=A0A916VK33_9GAMM|nr:SDR family oxidoreductase [Pseudohongiella nitratireducens]MDF1624483.1 SDR family oxidoreductase [Pseudohongiella nitratireducens]GFZ81932.1 short chain dehydrogenase [Pseudohongiella nitratireducens]
MTSLQGKNVVVIGGTSGIGLATALAAAEQGAKVWAAGRSQEHLEKAGKIAEGQENITLTQLDTHDDEGLKALFESIGTVDHLVSAATGGTRTLAPFVEQTEEQFQAAFGKLWGYAKVARLGAAYVPETGSITFVSGAPARRHKANMSALSCVGGAVENMVRCLAVELAPKRVNVVSPGIIDTALFDWMGEEKDERVAAMTQGQLVPRIGKPQEVASAVIYLMQNGYATGTTVDVDGGQLLS